MTFDNLRASALHSHFLAMAGHVQVSCLHCLRKCFVKLCDSPESALSTKPERGPMPALPGWPAQDRPGRRRATRLQLANGAAEVAVWMQRRAGPFGFDPK